MGRILRRVVSACRASSVGQATCSSCRVMFGFPAAAACRRRWRLFRKAAVHADVTDLARQPRNSAAHQWARRMTCGVMSQDAKSRTAPAAISVATRATSSLGSPRPASLASASGITSAHGSMSQPSRPAADPQCFPMELDPLIADEISMILARAYGAPIEVVQRAAALVQPPGRKRE